eukprot:7382881-Prymnesium_polylepis.4
MFVNGLFSGTKSVMTAVRGSFKHAPVPTSGAFDGGSFQTALRCLRASRTAPGARSRSTSPTSTRQRSLGRSSRSWGCVS